MAIWTNVFGSFLAVAFDAVGRDVVQERGLMSAGGAGADQIRMVAQQFFEDHLVAGDDGVGGSFEVAHGGIRAGGGFDVVRELRPAFEALGAGDDKLGGG